MTVDPIGDEYTISIRGSDPLGNFGSIALEFIGKEGESYFKPQIAEQVLLPNGETGHIFGVTVEVTELGAPLEYVRGNFRGTITAGDNGAGGPEYSNFAGTFSVLRGQ
jgi:hypothetical protein